MPDVTTQAVAVWYFTALFYFAWRYFDEWRSRSQYGKASIAYSLALFKLLATLAIGSSGFLVYHIGMRGPEDAVAATEVLGNSSRFANLANQGVRGILSAAIMLVAGFRVYSRAKALMGTGKRSTTSTSITHLVAK